MSNEDMQNQDRAVDPSNDAPVQGTQVEDTQQQDQGTSPSSEDGRHDDNASNDSQSASNNGTPDSTQVDQQVDLTEYQRLKREDGKLQQTQKEYEALQIRFNNLSDFIQEDPERFKQALVRTAGYTEQDAQAAVEQLQQQRQMQTQQPQMQGYQQQPQAQQGQIQNQQPQLTPQQLQQEIDKRLQEKEIQRNFIQKFPEMDPSKVKDDVQRAELRAVAIATDNLAGDLLASGAANNIEEAMEKAYTRITGKNATDINKAREEGVNEGLVQGMNAMANTSSPAIAGTQGKASNTNLNAEQRKAADELGMSYERFEQMEKSNTSVANI